MVAATGRLLPRPQLNDSVLPPASPDADAEGSVLYYAELDLRRARYEREGKLEKLREVQTKWPKGERVRIYN
jgi:hypothetical protein